MENPSASEQVAPVTVIAVKLPFDLEERILTFPFLHALHEYYPKAELHFITPKKEIEVLNLLPFKAYYHEYDEDEITSVFDVHRYCVHAKLYNVDIFISLTNSFVDACLGLGLRAKRRVGFADNWKALVLTDKINRPIGHHVVEDYFALFSTLTGVPANTRLRVISRDLTSIVEDPEDEGYLAINLSPLRNPTIESDWVDLLSQFEGQRILLFSTDEVVKFQGLIGPYMASLPSQNRYENFVYKDWIELARMLAHAKGVISYSEALGALSAYVGTRTLLLYEHQDPQKTGPFYFMADVAVMGANNTPTQEGAIKPRVRFNMDDVLNKALEFFRL